MGEKFKWRWGGLDCNLYVVIIKWLCYNLYLVSSDKPIRREVRGMLMSYVNILIINVNPWQQFLSLIYGWDSSHFVPLLGPFCTEIDNV